MFIIEIFIGIIIFIIFMISEVYMFKKNRKYFKLILALGICLFTIFGYHLYSLIQPKIFPTFTQTLHLNWKIDLPKPKEELMIASNTDGFGGETFLILQHNSNDINELEKAFQWSEKDEYILNGINTFMGQLNVGLKPANTSQEKIKTNNIILNTNFKYFKKDQKDSYIIFILSSAEKRIYAMQSLKGF